MPLGLGVALQQPYNGKDNRGNCGPIPVDAKAAERKSPGHKARTPWVVRSSPRCPVTKPPSHLCHRGNTELIALRVGHDDIVVLRIAIVSHDLRADSDEPFYLARLVIGIQVQVHLVARGDWRPGELKRDVRVLSAEYTEVIVRRQ